MEVGVDSILLSNYKGPLPYFLNKTGLSVAQVVLKQLQPQQHKGPHSNRRSCLLRTLCVQFRHSW